MLNAYSEIEVLRVSDVYETDPVGYADQPPFLNMAAVLGTALAPHKLLAVMQDIENQLASFEQKNNNSLLEIERLNKEIMNKENEIEDLNILINSFQNHIYELQLEINNLIDIK